MQGTGKACNRENCTDRNAIGGNFRFLCQMRLQVTATCAHINAYGCERVGFPGLQASPTPRQPAYFVNILEYNRK